MESDESVRNRLAQAIPRDVWELDKLHGEQLDELLEIQGIGRRRTDAVGGVQEKVFDLAATRIDYIGDAFELRATTIDLDEKLPSSSK
jgi:hypothetical protein